MSLSQRLPAVIIGALGAQLLGDYLLIAFLMAEPTVKITIPIPHYIFVLLVMSVPVPVGAAVGWFVPRRVMGVTQRLRSVLSRYWIS
jgi:hypothetical protein